METYQVLERGLRVLDERGWHGGSAIKGPGGCLCAGGALMEALDCDWEGMSNHPAAVALARAMGDENPTHLPSGWIALVNERASLGEIRAAYQSAIRAEKAKAGIPFNLPTEVAEGEPVRV